MGFIGYSFTVSSYLTVYLRLYLCGLAIFVSNEQGSPLQGAKRGVDMAQQNGSAGAQALSINNNVFMLFAYMFMGLCLFAGAILVLTQPLPFAENPIVMKVGMGWVMLPVSAYIIGSNVVKFAKRRNAIVVDERGITDNSDSMGSGFTPWEQISEVFLLKLKDDTYLCAVPANYDEWVKTRNRRQARLAQANMDMGFAPIRIQFKKATDRYIAQDGLNAVKRFHPEKVTHVRKPKY